MIKTILIVTLTAVGQPPVTYRAEFDKLIDCLGARSDALVVYEKAYGFGIYPRSPNSDAMPENEFHVQIRAECIAPDDPHPEVRPPGVGPVGASNDAVRALQQPSPAR